MRRVAKVLALAAIAVAALAATCPPQGGYDEPPTRNPSPPPNQGL